MLFHVLTWPGPGQYMEEHSKDKEDVQNRTIVIRTSAWNCTEACGEFQNE